MQRQASPANATPHKAHTDTARTRTFVGEKKRDALPLSVLGSFVKRTVAIGVGEVRVGAIVQQFFQQGNVVVEDGL